MKRHTWNSGKNTKLKTGRGVSFEMVMERISKGAFRVRLTPSKSHGDQNAYYVTLHGVLYVVPFTETETRVFLHTIMRYQK